MKKSLIFFSTLALAGLLASCQKENVVAPEQTAEQKVITIDSNDFKSDAGIEPLMALSQALDQTVQEGDKKVSRVKEILRECFRLIANVIGSNESDVSRSTRYFGNWKTFGAAIAEIQGLSYDARVPYIELELGNATDFKIGRVEVMPFTDFLFKYVGDFSFLDPVSPIEPPIVGYGQVADGHLAPVIEDRPGTREGIFCGLIVKFTYELNTYAFVISARGEEGELKDYADYIKLDIGYGRYIPHFESLAEWYQAYTNNDVRSFPISYSSEFYIHKSDVEDYLWLYRKGLALTIDTFEGESDSSGASFLRFGYGVADNYGSNRYYQAFAQSDDPVAAKDFYRDFLKAEAFGCSQSEIEALISEYQQTFTDVVWLFGYAPDESRCTFKTNLTVGALAKQLRWKPALGFSYDNTFVPFEELTQFNYESTDFKAYWKYLCENTSVSGFEKSPDWYTMFDD